MSFANSFNLRSGPAQRGPGLRSKQSAYFIKLVQISANGIERVKDVTVIDTNINIDLFLRVNSKK